MKHVDGLSDEKTIQAIQENPYMTLPEGKENEKIDFSRHDMN